MRWATIVAGVFLGTCGVLAAESARAAITHYDLNIPRQPLDTALKDLAQQTGLQVGRFSDAIRGDTLVGPLSGHYSADEALKFLLGPSRLTYRTLNDRAVIVLRPEDLNQFPPADESQSSTRPLSNETVPASSEHTSSWDRLRLAQGSQGSPAQVAPVEGQGMEQNPQRGPIRLDEVVVTAQKRDERLQDVPVPVTTISAATLLSANNTRIQDYYSNIPNFSISPSPSAGGEQMLAIRGISTGFGTNPTVGITVDDVPFGSSSNLLGNTIPDIDPSDLARVEVLRGPQGTLYGASSMGGLLKFVTVDPSTDRLSGRLETDVIGVHNGNAPGYGLRGAANVPLTDTLAVRVSGFTREDPGYIDNPITGRDGLNKAVAYGGRFSALWRPSDAFSLKLGALYQDLKSQGSSDVDLLPTLSGLQQNYIPGIGGADRQVQVYSAVANLKLGSATLTSVTGYNINKITDSFDFSYLDSATANTVFNRTGLGAAVLTNGKNEKFSQEIRADIPLGSFVEWLVGGFYTHEKTPFAQDVRAFDQATGADAGDLLYLPVPATYTEYAGFTDLTFKITEAFDIQFGARESRIEQTNEAATETGPLLTGGLASVTAVTSSADAFTYLVTPRLRLSPNLMVYARLASGYRAGGPNSFNTDPTVPRQYNPDKTYNYEIGVKGDVLDHRISFDGSLFYIDWKDLQLNLLDPNPPNITYTTNATRAKSQGVELSVQARPVDGLTLDAWVTWDDAVLTENMPANSTVVGSEGDRLPYSSRFSGNFSVNDDFPLTDNLTGYAGATVSYVGDRVGTFLGSPDRQIYPSYTRTDVHGGVAYDAWKVNLFVTNITDQRGVLGGGAGTYPPFAFRYIQPRTVGVSLSRDF
jgi:iron complex outermembrane recepter protein